MTEHHEPGTVGWYIATERFGPESGGAWDTFVDWSGLDHLDEVVSLDPMISPTVFQYESIPAHYWPHIVNEDFLLDFFVDLPFLLGEIAAIGAAGDCNILCVYRNPAGQPPTPEGFTFLGYDLVDAYRSASALTNCGGFPAAFDNAELNRVGLLPTLERATEVRAALQRHYPDQEHARCDVWAVCRRIAAPSIS